MRKHHTKEIDLPWNNIGSISDLTFIQFSDMVYNLTTDELIKARIDKTHYVYAAIPFLEYTAKNIEIEDLTDIFDSRNRYA